MTRFETHPNIPFPILIKDDADKLLMGYTYHPNNIGLEELADGRWLCWKKHTPFTDSGRHPKKQYIVLNETNGELAERIFKTCRKTKQFHLLTILLVFTIPLFMADYDLLASICILLAFGGILFEAIRYLRASHTFAQKVGTPLTPQEILEIPPPSRPRAVSLCIHIFNWVCVPLLLLLFAAPIISAIF